MTRAHALRALAIAILAASSLALSHRSFGAGGEEARIRREARAEYERYLHALQSGHASQQSCWLYEESRTCLIVRDLPDDSPPKGFQGDTTFAAPYRAFSPFDVLGVARHWPPQEKDVVPLCEVPHLRDHWAVLQASLAPLVVKARTVTIDADASDATESGHDAAASTESWDKLFSNRSAILSRFDDPIADRGSGASRQRILAPISVVQDGPRALAFWEYWASRKQSCSGLDCPFVYRDSAVSISYCDVLAVGNEFGPPRRCTRVVVYMPDGAWVSVYSGPWGGGGCGFGEADIVCGIPESYATFLRGISAALGDPPLSLAVASRKHRIVGIAKMRPSPVLANYFELLSVEVDDQMVGDDVGVSVTVLVSRQNSPNLSDYHAANEAQQARYVRAIRALLRPAGCRSPGE